MSGDAPPYHLAHAKEASLTPLVFFYNQFYYYLFELLPEVKSMFTKGMAAQGRMLANVVKYIITNLDVDHASVFKDSLQHLARVHNVRGVTAEHYSVMVRNTDACEDAKARAMERKTMNTKEYNAQ